MFLLKYIIKKICLLFIFHVLFMYDKDVIICLNVLFLNQEWKLSNLRYMIYRWERKKKIK